MIDTFTPRPSTIDPDIPYTREQRLASLNRYLDFARRQLAYDAAQIAEQQARAADSLNRIAGIRREILAVERGEVL